jgi:hypothetical protein
MSENTAELAAGKEHVLSEIKTLLRILNTWGNTLVPSLNGEQISAQERLHHFVSEAQTRFGMSVEEIELAIS